MSCGLVDYRKALKFAFNMLVLTTENDEMEVELEMRRIGNGIKKTVALTVDCIKNNLDKDYINDFKLQ